jgi:hypothetical protein
MQKQKQKQKLKHWQLDVWRYYMPGHAQTCLDKNYQTNNATFRTKLI